MGIIIRPGVGQVTHSDTLGRGANDSHPVSSITGLSATISAHDWRIGSLETDVGTLQGSMGTAEGDITDLQGRMGTAEGEIDALQTDAARIAEVYNILAYGAVPGQNIASALQAAIDAANAAGGGTVFIPAASSAYLLNATVSMKTNVRLVSEPGAVINMAGMASSPKTAISAIGSLGSSIALTASAVKGAFSVTLNSVAGLAVGDYLQIATAGVNYYPYKPTYNVDRGEIKRIHSIASNTVTFEEPFYDGYTVANSAFAKKVSFVENIGIEGITLIGGSSATGEEHGIYLQYVNGFRIRNNQLIDQDWYQIAAASCIKGEISGNECRMSYYDGTNGSIFYAIALFDSCQWIRVQNNHAERTRHLFVNSAHSAGQNYYGCPRFISVVGNVAKNMMVNGAGASWAYESHGFGDSILIHDNIADGCYGGISIENGNVSVKGNVIKNYTVTGIEFSGDGREYKNVHVVGNQISNRIGSATANPIKFTVTAGAVVDDVVIEDNLILGDGSSSFLFYLIGNQPIAGLVVANNTFRHEGSGIGSNYAANFGSSTGKIIVQGNRFINCKSAVYAMGDDVVIKGNEVLLDSGSIAGAAFYIGGDRAVLDGNVIDRTYVGIIIDASAVSAIVSNNVIKRPIGGTHITDNGTTTVKQNNVLAYG